MSESDDHSKSNVVFLDQVRSSGPLTPISALNMALSEYESGERTHAKLVIIFFDSTGNEYRHGYINAGLRRSELVSLLEIQKASFIDEMTAAGK